MNEYDNDHDELDDYSSSNSFRARSNTWPLNKPDFPTPSSNVCIDETLPEIELEEDDLFTTNENWSAGFVDHDIMSWDPILNAQNQQQQSQLQQQQQQQQQQLQASNQPPTIHHQPQQITNISQQQQHLNTQTTSSQSHQRQPSIHLQQQLPHQQPHQQPQQHCHQQHHHHAPSSQAAIVQHRQHQHEQPPSHHRPPLPQPPHSQPPPPAPSSSSSSSSQQTHDSFLDNSGGGSIGPNEIMIGPQNATQLQRQQQSPNNHHEQRLQHQTLNDSSCLDADETNDYHIHQLHHLSLDGGPTDHQQQSQPPLEHYPTAVATATSNVIVAVPLSQMSAMCLTPSDPNNDYDGVSIGPPAEHQHHARQQSHLQPLTSARYDFDHNHRHHLSQNQQQNNDYDLKLNQDGNLNSQHPHHQHLNHLDHHQHHQHQQQHHNPHHSTASQQQQQFDQHHPHQQLHQHHHQQQYHDLTSSSLDNGSGSSRMLSSSLSTSGIGLSTDLEDLDYKPSGISTIYDDAIQHQQQSSHQLQQSELQSNLSETVKNEVMSQSKSSVAGKLGESNSASKTKLNAPRRNAWGNMSYADLISQAIESTSDKRLTLAQIYDWMVQHVPYFKDKGDSNSSAGWKNSVRHNLSLHSRFKRLQNEGTGKSSWWTINPEANIGKCARRRAASMEASKYEKKRGRAKKRADAIRQGLVSYPSLTNSSLNGSTNTLGEQQSQAQSLSHFHAPATTNTTTTTTEQIETSQQQSQDNNLQSLDQFANQQTQQQETTHMPLLQIQKFENYNIDQPSQQQQQHLRQLQQADRQEQQQRQQQQQQQQQQQDCADNSNLQHDFHLGYGSSQQTSLQLTHQSQKSQQVNASQFEENDDNNKLQQQQQSQYYYQQFELSTAL